MRGPHYYLDDDEVRSLYEVVFVVTFLCVGAAVLAVWVAR
jgi:hypothetical protein